MKLLKKMFISFLPLVVIFIFLLSKAGHSHQMPQPEIVSYDMYEVSMTIEYSDIKDELL